MPTWNEVLKEIQVQSDPFIAVRQKYLSQLFKKRGRNVIAYYSGWLQRPPNTPRGEISDIDKNAFMSVIHGLDRNKGLDLILHTPGGEVAATESLVDYLKQTFNSDFEVFVPLEDNQEIQDIVLTIHHTYMHTLNSAPIIKITENHKNVGQILSITVPQRTSDN